MNADGTGETQLTHTPDVYEFGPAWQPVPQPGYPRPAGASPLRVSLVPAFERCDAPNRTHGPPLSFGSCAPPDARAGFMTFGSAPSGTSPQRRPCAPGRGCGQPGLRQPGGRLRSPFASPTCAAAPTSRTGPAASSSSCRPDHGQVQRCVQLRAGDGPRHRMTTSRTRCDSRCRVRKRLTRPSGPRARRPRP